MKTNFKLLSFFVLAAVTLSSCSSDDDSPLIEDAPLITNFEYGEGSSHGDEQVGYKGSDIHLEAEIVAEGTVSSIALDIHAHDLEPGEDEVEWDFEQIYTDADYLVKNPVFHEHVDVPANIPSGEYHITLTVTDSNGNSTEIEGHIHIMDAVTTSALSIEESVTVDIHAHGLTVGEGEQEWHFEQVYEEGYHGETSVEFHEHIDVPVTAPVGEYHMVITIEDEEGNTSKIDTHINVTL
mgnify:CR=1 FL=1